MIIAEDLLLLLMDDAEGKPLADSTKLDYALAGAVMLELAFAGRVDVEKGTGWLAKDKLVVVDPTPLGQPALDGGLARIQAKAPIAPQNLIGGLAKGLRDELLRGLGARGILRMERSKVLGLFPTTRWPAADVQHEGAVRQRLTGVLAHGLTPDPRDAALISLLSAIDVVPKVVEGDRGQLKRRAKEIAAQDWASGAVKKAVEAMNAAVMTAVVAASTAGAASGGS